MVNFERDYFKDMSVSKQRDYIDKLIHRGIRLTPEELEVATREQKRIYINLLIAQIKPLETHEIEAATPKQMHDYITQKRWVSMPEYPYLPDKFKKVYLDVLISKRLFPNKHEFENTPEHLRVYLAKRWFERGFNITPSIFSYLNKEQQKKTIDSVLASGNKLILDFIPYMKPGVETYYKKAIKEHPYLWEGFVRKQIRKTLLESIVDMEKVKKIITALKKDEFFELLDSSKAPGTTPMEGACWIVADALNIAFGWPVYAVYNRALEHIEHFVVKVGDNKYLDAMGLQTEYELLEEMVLIWHLSNRTDITTRDMRIIEYDSDFKNLTKGIIQDLNASKRIADYLQIETSKES